MYEKAIEKIRDEMAVNAEESVVVEIGELLCHWLSRHRSAAAAVIAEGKTLTGAAKTLEEEARKIAGGKRCAAIGPEAAQKIVLRYFGLDDSQKASVTRGGFEVSLDELLEG